MKFSWEDEKNLVLLSAENFRKAEKVRKSFGRNCNPYELTKNLN